MLVLSEVKERFILHDIILKHENESVSTFIYI